MNNEADPEHRIGRIKRPWGLLEGYNKRKKKGVGGYGWVGTSIEKISIYLLTLPTFPPNPHTPLPSLSKKRTSNEWPRVLRENRGPPDGAIHIYSLEYTKQCESHAFRRIPTLNQLPLGILAGLNRELTQTTKTTVTRTSQNKWFNHTWPKLTVRGVIIIILNLNANVQRNVTYLMA